MCAVDYHGHIDVDFLFLMFITSTCVRSSVVFVNVFALAF